MHGIRTYDRVTTNHIRLVSFIVPRKDRKQHYSLIYSRIWSLSYDGADVNGRIKNIYILLFSLENDNNSSEVHICTIVFFLTTCLLEFTQPGRNVFLFMIAPGGDLVARYCTSQRRACSHLMAKSRTHD